MSRRVAADGDAGEGRSSPQVRNLYREAGPAWEGVSSTGPTVSNQ
ncbi:rCG33823 [Rattus norvegicus]|uniref:RCG33823 n=1 Tax=Rattus norvegicus TaxID=10116 RepID=A6HF24_RAT|nr:rCG33823 [Rattus norvegicus]